MFIKQLSLFVENRPCALSAVCNVLKEKQINIRTLSLADTSNFGILRLLIQNYEAAKSALEAAGFIVKVTDVVALLVPDRAGGMADVLAILDKHGISVEYIYAFSYGAKGQAAIVCRFDDQESAMAKLAGEPVQFVTSGELFA